MNQHWTKGIPTPPTYKWYQFLKKRQYNKNIKLINQLAKDMKPALDSLAKK